MILKIRNAEIKDEAVDLVLDKIKELIKAGGNKVNRGTAVSILLNEYAKIKYKK